MAKKKNQLFAASELILLILAGTAACGIGAVLDLTSMMISYRGRSLHSDLKKVLKSIGGSFTAATIRRTLAYLEKRELIEKISSGWKISKRGLKEIEPKLPKRMKGVWDGKWRIIIFDIEEKSRKVRGIVRSYLKALGCGMIQFSVWVSPYDIEKYLSKLKLNLNLGNKLRWFTCMDIDDEKDLVNRCWKLSDLAFEYEKLLISGKNLPKQLKVENYLAFKIWEKAYLKVLSDDPMLPEHLLPEGWKGAQVAQLHLMLNRRFQNYQNNNLLTTS